MSDDAHQGIFQKLLDLIHEHLDKIASYGSGMIGIFIASLPSIDNFLQFVLLVSSIAVMIQKFLHDRRKNKRPMNDNRDKK